MNFLERVASDIYKDHQGDLSELCIVFPNKRAAVFFTKHLANVAKKTVWMPRLLTISEYFQQFSNLRPADPLALNAELYRIFSEHFESRESFDSFYSWGEMLLRDFDELDKNLVNAHDLFRVLIEEKNIVQQFSYLTEEQVMAIRTFWQSFVPPDFSEEQESFLHIWKILPEVYDAFKSSLAAGKTGYEGMIYRDVAAAIAAGNAPDQMNRKTFFVGFNALNRAETTVFEYHKKNGTGFYYWDADLYYLEDAVQEAGTFLRTLIKRYPSKLPPSDSLHPRANKNIHVIGVPLAAGQAKITAQLLQDEHMQTNDTAVILPDENMLMPLLNSLPADFDEVNVTMGYPARQSNAFSLIASLIELQRYARDIRGVPSFYFKPAFDLLANPYMHAVLGEWPAKFMRECRDQNIIHITAETLGDAPPAARMIFTRTEGGAAFADYAATVTGTVHAAISDEGNGQDETAFNISRELIYHLHLELRKMRENIRVHGLELKDETVYRLIRQHVANIRIPFTGEPLQGLQIMGLLESRNLDFRNVFILNMNEGRMPADSNAPSFIPYHLRKGFGLPTSEYRDATFAYYFYRLLHKAENIYLLYNTQTEGASKGEISRYILQLQHEAGFAKINFVQQSQHIQSGKIKPISVPKTTEIMQKLLRYTAFPGNEKESHLTPSAINTYLDCRLRFYFRYIAGIYEQPDITEEVDAATFGNLLHYSMENIYAAFHATHPKQVIDKSHFAYIHSLAAPAIDKAFAQVFRPGAEDSPFDFSGAYLVIREVIVKYVVQVLRLDEAYAPFSLEATEDRLIMDYPVAQDGNTIPFRIGGRIDRIDLKNGILRIVDYKTGGDNGKSEFSDMASLFARGDEKRKGLVFQVMLYAFLAEEKYRQQYKVQPGLLFVREAMGKNTDTRLVHKAEKSGIPLDDITGFREEFRSYLDDTLRDMTDLQQPFDQVKNTEICSYCYYKMICHRE